MADGILEYNQYIVSVVQSTLVQFQSSLPGAPCCLELFNPRKVPAQKFTPELTAAAEA